MKLIEHFDSFLRDEVNLNQARIDRLEGHVDAVVGFVRSTDSFGTILRRVLPQGSWQHRTIIKPHAKKEFDADLALFLDPLDEWNPADYVEQLYQAFRSHGTYCAIVSRKSRCVTVDYSGDFHLDIAPIVSRTFLATTHYAQNRTTNEEEQTDPEGYSDWFSEKNAFTQNNMLTKVTRLVKYMRDIKQTFSIRSILLSTLLGNQVKEGSFGDDPAECYPDVATSLLTVFGRLDDYLQENETAPDVRNPALWKESFSRHWDERIYANLRNRVAFYRQRIDDAYAEENRLASIAKWRKVFGDSFAESVGLPASAVAATSLPAAPHEQAPVWQMSRSEGVVVDAYIYDNQKRRRFGGLNSGGHKLAKGLWLKFVAETTADPPFEVYWQVVNTGAEAASAGKLRGGFDCTEGSLFHWEHTEYTGCHWIRCFVVRNGMCIAESPRFVILIR